MCQPRRSRIQTTEVGDVTVVNFIDREIQDERNIQKIGEDLFALVDEDGHKKILLNFANVELFGASAMGKLIILNKKISAAGGKLILCNIDTNIYEVFELTKLNKLFNIQKEEHGALLLF